MASGLTTIWMASSRSTDVPSFGPDVCVFIDTLVSQISLVPSPLAPPMSFGLGALVARLLFPPARVKTCRGSEEMAPRGGFEACWPPLPRSVNFKAS